MPRKSGIRLDEDEFAELVGNIYDAAIDPSAWHRVLSELRDATHSSCANLLGVHHENTEVALLADVDVDPQCSAEYATHYASICPRIEYGQRFPQERIYYDDQLGGEPFINSNEWYAWIAKYNLRYFIAGFLYDHEYGRGVVALQRSKSEGHVDRSEISFFSKILPHLQRAAQIGRRLEQQALWRHADGDAFDQLSAGIILTDTDGRIQLMNQSAEAIIGRRDGMTVRRQRLVARLNREGRKLEEVISRACQSRLVDRRATTLRITCATSLQPYVVTVAPVSTEIAAFSLPGPGAIIVISDPSRKTGLDEQGLASIYGLTAAEAKLAIALSSGQSLADYAKGSGIAIATARVHLRHAMDKTDVRRQADLVRLTLLVEAGSSTNEH